MLWTAHGADIPARAAKKYPQRCGIFGTEKIFVDMIDRVRRPDLKARRWHPECFLPDWSKV
jgi:hypothetical protein